MLPLNSSPTPLMGRFSTGDFSPYPSLLIGVDKALGNLNDGTQYLIFMADMGTGTEATQAARECGRAVAQVIGDLWMDKNLYLRLQGTMGHAAEERRLLEKYLLKFKKNGIHLEEGARPRFKELPAQLGALQSEYLKNMNEDMTSVMGCSS